MIVWEPTRQVLWRKTSSSYLADHVESVSITYYDRLGDVLTPAEMALVDWPDSVARVSIALVVAMRAERSSVLRDALVGPQ